MVYVLGRNQKPIMPCTEKRATLLLSRGRARVVKMYPFTIRLIDRTQTDCVLQPVLVKIDPGSKITGIAVVREEEEEDHQVIISLIELKHRGSVIRDALTQRRSFRRRRRGNLRYRAPRFLNRTRPQGWLPPSLQHRVDTTMSWIARLCKLLPVTGLAQELVRFDMQLMENAEISGAEYQQGTLAGTELREYILERDDRTCQYCGAQDVPLNLDHIVARSKGGATRPSNLVLACVPCNEKKGSQPLAVFERQTRSAGADSETSQETAARCVGSQCNSLGIVASPQ